jgi:hypothetical protein
MIETTVIMVKTPMMMPSSVRNVLNLLVQREPMAIETDSPILTLAIVFIYILQYMIRMREAKVFLTTHFTENKMRE